MTSFIIIGAGISGLVLGRELTKSYGKNEIMILEKSRGLGGRIATRRGESTRFDHGIPMIPGEELRLLGLSHTKQMTDGATSIAKEIASNLPIEKNLRATEISATQSGWIVKTAEGSFKEAKTVILTAPLPQALELLTQSKIDFSKALVSISYECAIVALIEGSGFHQTEIIHSFDDEVFLSLVNEQKKGISASPAWTLTFSPSFSEKHFELPEEDLKKITWDAIITKWPEFKGTIEIKKWRYSKPRGFIPKFFETVSSNPDLYLCGDSFSPDSSRSPFESAIVSALELSKVLERKSEDSHILPHAP